MKEIPNYSSFIYASVVGKKMRSTLLSILRHLEEQTQQGIERIDEKS